MSSHPTRRVCASDGLWYLQSMAAVCSQVLLPVKFSFVQSRRWGWCSSIRHTQTYSGPKCKKSQICSPGGSLVVVSMLLLIQTAGMGLRSPGSRGLPGQGVLVGLRLGHQRTTCQGQIQLAASSGFKSHSVASCLWGFLPGLVLVF